MDMKKQIHATMHHIGLEVMLDKLREEHEALRHWALELDAAAVQTDRLPGPATAADELLELKPKLLAFMKELEKHADWEEEQLIPLIDSYYNRKTAPTMMASIWVMEKDHELAIEFLQAFLQMTAGFGPYPSGGAVAEAIRCLRQGCKLLKEHFSIEEETLFPFAEEMLADLDCLFS